MVIWILLVLGCYPQCHMNSLMVFFGEHNYILLWGIYVGISGLKGLDRSGFNSSSSEAIGKSVNDFYVVDQSKFSVLIIADLSET